MPQNVCTMTTEMKALNDRSSPRRSAARSRVSGMKDSVLPVEQFQSPAVFKLQPELIRELAHKAFERIEVWPTCLPSVALRRRVPP